MGIWDNSGIFGIFGIFESSEITEIENAGNVEDIVKIVISVIISNSQILDMYATINDPLLTVFGRVLEMLCVCLNCHVESVFSYNLQKIYC